MPRDARCHLAQEPRPQRVYLATIDKLFTRARGGLKQVGNLQHLPTVNAPKHTRAASRRFNARYHFLYGHP